LPSGGRALGSPNCGIFQEILEFALEGVDTVLDVSGPMTRFSGKCSACPLLLDVLSELRKSPRFFVEPGLHLAELLELCVLTPRRD
jgi:hypothetical protein